MDCQLNSIESIFFQFNLDRDLQIKYQNLESNLKIEELQKNEEINNIKEVYFNNIVDQVYEIEFYEKDMIQVICYITSQKERNSKELLFLQKYFAQIPYFLELKKQVNNLEQQENIGKFQKISPLTHQLVKSKIKRYLPGDTLFNFGEVQKTMNFFTLLNGKCSLFLPNKQIEIGKAEFTFEELYDNQLLNNENNDTKNQMKQFDLIFQQREQIKYQKKQRNMNIINKNNVLNIVNFLQKLVNMHKEVRAESKYYKLKYDSIYGDDIKKNSINSLQKIVFKNEKYFKDYQKNQQIISKLQDGQYNIQEQELQGQQQLETKKLGDKFIFNKSDQYLDNNLIEQALKNQSLKFNINQGHPFGEISALTSKPRTGTVVCNSECYFLEIEPEQFRSIYQITMPQKFKEKINFLNQFTFIQSLKINQLMTVIYEINEKVYEKDQNIYHQGDVAKSIFLIKEGEVEIVETSKQIEQEISQKINEKNTKNNDNILISQFLSRNNDDFQQISGMQGLRKLKRQNTWLKQKKEQTILILGDNSYFGDEELVLKKSQRVYTARSRSRTTIYEIDLAILSLFINKKNLMSLLEKRSLMKENQKQTRLNQICLGNLIQHDLKSKENNQIRITQPNTVKKQQLKQIQSSKERELSKINTLQSSNNQLTKYSDDSLELINNTELDETAHNDLIKNYKKKEENQEFKNNQINMYVQQLRDKKHNINKKKTAFIGNHHEGIVQTTGSKKQAHIIKNYDEVDFSNSKGSNEDNSSNKYSSLSKQNKYKEDSQSSYKKLKDITQSQEQLKYYKQDEILQKNQGFMRMRTFNGQFITNFETIENLQNRRDQKSASPGVNFRHYKRSQFKHLSTQPSLHNKLVKNDSGQNQLQKNDNQDQKSKYSIKPIQVENDNNNIKNNNNNQKQEKRQSQFIQQNLKGSKQSIAVNVNESLLSESQNNTKLKQLLRYQGFTNKVFNQSQNSGLNLNQDLQKLQNSINLQKNNSLIFNNVRKSSRLSIDKNFNLGQVQLIQNNPKSVKQSQNLSNSRTSSNLDYNQSKNRYLKQKQTSQTSIKDSDYQYNQQNFNNINMDYSINVNIINSSKRLNNINDNNQIGNAIQSNRASSLNQISICKSQLTISPQNSPLKRGSNQKLDNTHKNSCYNEVFSADSIQQQDLDIEILKNQAQINKNQEINFCQSQQELNQNANQIHQKQINNKENQKIMTGNHVIEEEEQKSFLSIENNNIKNNDYFNKQELQKTDKIDINHFFNVKRETSQKFCAFNDQNNLNLNDQIDQKFDENYQEQKLKLDNKKVAFILYNHDTSQSENQKENSQTIQSDKSISHSFDNINIKNFAQFQRLEKWNQFLNNQQNKRLKNQQKQIQYQLYNSSNQVSNKNIQIEQNYYIGKTNNFNKNNQNNKVSGSLEYKNGQFYKKYQKNNILQSLRTINQTSNVHQKQNTFFSVKSLTSRQNITDNGEYMNSKLKLNTFQNSYKQLPPQLQQDQDKKDLQQQYYPLLQIPHVYSEKQFRPKQYYNDIDQNLGKQYKYDIQTEHKEKYFKTKLNQKEQQQSPQLLSIKSANQINNFKSNNNILLQKNWDKQIKQQNQLQQQQNKFLKIQNQSQNYSQSQTQTQNQNLSLNLILNKDSYREFYNTNNTTYSDGSLNIQNSQRSLNLIDKKKQIAKSNLEEQQLKLKNISSNQNIHQFSSLEKMFTPQQKKVSYIDISQKNFNIDNTIKNKKTSIFCLNKNISTKVHKGKPSLFNSKDQI